MKMIKSGFYVQQIAICSDEISAKLIGRDKWRMNHCFPTIFINHLHSLLYAHFIADQNRTT